MQARLRRFAPTTLLAQSPASPTPAGKMFSSFDREVDTFRGAGCSECSGTGYRARVGIFELMELNDEIRKLIMANSDASEITHAAKRNGMRQLREDGWEKISEGVTSADEVMRVTQEF